MKIMFHLKANSVWSYLDLGKNTRQNKKSCFSHREKPTLFLKKPFKNPKTIKLTCKIRKKGDKNKKKAVEMANEEKDNFETIADKEKLDMEK